MPSTADTTCTPSTRNFFMRAPLLVICYPLLYLALGGGLGRLFLPHLISSLLIHFFLLFFIHPPKKYHNTHYYFDLLCFAMLESIKLLFYDNFIPYSLIDYIYFEIIIYHSLTHVQTTIIYLIQIQFNIYIVYIFIFYFFYHKSIILTPKLLLLHPKIRTKIFTLKIAHKCIFKKKSNSC